jgi:hypothetical protein
LISRRLLWVALALLSSAAFASPAEVVIDYPWHAPLAKKAAPAGVNVFAFPHAVDLDSRRDGVWSEANGVRRWELTIRVRGARSLAAELTFNPAHGSALAVAGETLIRQKQRFVSEHTGKETITLTMSAPASSGDPHVAVTGLRLSEPKRQAKATEPGKWINYDCHRTPENDPNGNASVGVGVDGGGFCSATLVNNKMGADGTPVPMILLAAHCRGDHSDDDQPMTVRLYWHAELLCGTSYEPDEDPYRSVFFDSSIEQLVDPRGAAVWPAREGDFWLIELDNWPPAAANAWLAGFDARDGAPPGSQCATGWNDDTQQPVFGHCPDEMYVDGKYTSDLVYGIHFGGQNPKQYRSTETWSYYPPNAEYNQSGGRLQLQSDSPEAIGGTVPGSSGSGTFLGSSDLLIAVTAAGGDEVTLSNSFGPIWTGAFNGGFGSHLVPNPTQASSRVLQGQSAPLPIEPRVAMDVDRTSISVGETVDLAWSSENVNACVASDAWTGTKSTSGNESVAIDTAGAHTFALTCDGDYGTATKEVLVTALATPAPTATPNPDGGGGGGGGAFDAWALAALILARRRRA